MKRVIVAVFVSFVVLLIGALVLGYKLLNQRTKVIEESSEVVAREGERRFNEATPWVQQMLADYPYNAASDSGVRDVFHSNDEVGILGKVENTDPYFITLSLYGSPYKISHSSATSFKEFDESEPSIEGYVDIVFDSIKPNDYVLVRTKEGPDGPLAIEVQKLIRKSN